MTYYLGRAGALVALPDPETEDMAPERVGGMHQLLSGKRVRDTLSRMKTWDLSWTALDLTAYGTLEDFYFAAVGPGPYVFFDPEQRNLLPANVSAGGDVTGDTTGWTFGPNGVVGQILNLASASLGGQYSLRLTEPTSVVAVQDLAYSAAVPVVAGLSYTFSAQLWIDTGGPQLYISMWWLDAAGAAISTSDSSAMSAGTSGVLSKTAAAPSNAVYVACHLRTNTANTSGSTKYAYTDSWQLEQAGSASTWVAGSGVPLVTVESLARTTPLAGVCDAQMQLQQVG